MPVIKIPAFSTIALGGKNTLYLYPQVFAGWSREFFMHACAYVSRRKLKLVLICLIVSGWPQRAATLKS